MSLKMNSEQFFFQLVIPIYSIWSILVYSRYLFSRVLFLSFHYYQYVYAYTASVMYVKMRTTI